MTRQQKIHAICINLSEHTYPKEQFGVATIKWLAHNE